MSKPSTSKISRTDWARVDALQDKDIDQSDIPAVTPAMFAKAVVRRGLAPLPAKQQITLRLDADVIAWFRDQGKGYQTQINAVLQAYMKEVSRRK